MRDVRNLTDPEKRKTYRKFSGLKEYSVIMHSMLLDTCQIGGCGGIGRNCCCAEMEAVTKMTEFNGSQVAEFYSGRSVFVTGASGFMGKVLVEKILRSCPGVEKIYLLIRTKNGQNTQQRLTELLCSKAFDRVKCEQPDSLSKLVPIHGDISQDGLGLVASDVQLLAENVSIVFHSAATVKFDEPLKASVDNNVLGTRQLVEICHKFPNLVALVHVSTAYCNCDRNDIEEIIYPPPVAPQHILDAVEWMDEDLLTSITPKLINGRPNTYTFTKSLAESLLAEECGGLPVAIVRPSIVTAAWKEPFPGWVDNLNGPTGLLVATSKGVLRSMLIDADIVADFIPVDVVINLMITVAWHTATYKPNNIMVYNCTSGVMNGLTWGGLERITYPLILRNPSQEVFRYPGGSFKTSRIVHTACMIVEHLLPACFLDFMCLVTGKKPRMVRLYKKIHRAVCCLEYFTTHEWNFHVDNMVALREQINAKDRQLFNFSIQDLSWPTYMESYLLGIRHFILKEEVSTLPAARKSLKRMYVISQLTNLVAIVVMWRLLMLRSQTARRLWFFTMKLALQLYSALPFTSVD